MTHFSDNLRRSSDYFSLVTPSSVIPVLMHDLFIYFVTIKKIKIAHCCKLAMPFDLFAGDRHTSINLIIFLVDLLIIEIYILNILILSSIIILFIQFKSSTDDCNTTDKEFEWTTPHIPYHKIAPLPSCRPCRCNSQRCQAPPSLPTHQHPMLQNPQLYILVPWKASLQSYCMVLHEASRPFCCNTKRSSCCKHLELFGHCFDGFVLISGYSTMEDVNNN